MTSRQDPFSPGDPRFPQGQRTQVGPDWDRINAVRNSLSMEHRLQLADLLEYLADIGDAKRNPHGHVPEGSVQALFARQPPEVQAALDAIGRFASEARFAPFEDKLSEAERFRQLGMNPETSTLMLAASDSLDVMYGLQSRMGTDTAPADWQRENYYVANHAPARDSVEKAVANHEPLRQMREQVDNFTADSSDGLSLRDTLSTCMDVHEQMNPSESEPEERSDMGKWIEATVDQGDFNGR